MNGAYVGDPLGAIWSPWGEAAEQALLMFDLRPQDSVLFGALVPYQPTQNGVAVCSSHNHTVRTGIICIDDIQCYNPYDFEKEAAG